MHPELIGALARQKTQERTVQARLRAPSRTPRGGPARPGRLRRARWQLGSVLLDVGLHLMVATSRGTAA